MNTTQEQGLVLTVRGLAVQAAQAEAVRAGLQAAAGAKGLIVTSDDENSIATDLIKTIQKGKRALKAGADSVLELPKAAVAAVREVCSPLNDQLVAGEAAINTAQTAYLRDKQRRQQEEERKERERIAEQARRDREAAEAAKAAGAAVVEEEAPPPPTLAPQRVETIVRGGQGSRHLVTRTVCRVVDLRAVAEGSPHWFVAAPVQSRVALEDFKVEVRRGEVAEPTLEKPVVWNGVEFYLDQSMSG